MCGFYEFRPYEGEVWKEIRVDRNEFEMSNLKSRFNISPTSKVVTVINDGEANHLRMMHWGLIPSWAKNKNIGEKMTNARSETLAERPSFKEAFKFRRCLILADGFYEWKKVPGRKEKQPYRIGLKNWKPFAFAGLWERWNDPEGGLIDSCTIITCPPNLFVKRIHDRMPVILPNYAYDTWLDPKNQDTSMLQKLLEPIPSSDMEAYPVTPAVENPWLNTEECIKPLSEGVQGVLAL